MISNILVKIKVLVHEILRFFGYRIFRIDGYSIFDFESFLYRHVAVYKSLTFIQIGANDGVMNDPIYRFNIENSSVVTGYALEPLPDVYEKLVKNYRSCPNIKTYNLGIHSTDSEMILHRVKPSRAHEVPDFARGIASFDENHWRKTTLIPSADYMEQVVVKCTSINNFITSIEINEIDLLLLDTEGYDFKILMSLDLDNFKPKIIRFEHGIRNSLMSQDDFINVCAHLNSFGYQIIAESYDATAYLLDPKDLIF